MISMRQLMKELSESGLLEAQQQLENDLIQTLTTKLLTADPKDHIELVSVKARIEGIKLLQSHREEMLSED